MDAAGLASMYPCLYHMAEEGSWSSIRRHGLLSTSALLDRCRVSGRRRAGIESEIRPRSVRVSGEEFGRAVIRDQGPLNRANLEKILDGVSVRQYCGLLNARTFFWVSKKRLDRLLGARLYKDKRHDVLTVETKSLVRDCLDRITLSPASSGTAVPEGKARQGHVFERCRLPLRRAQEKAPGRAASRARRRLRSREHPQACGACGAAARGRAARNRLEEAGAYGVTCGARARCAHARARILGGPAAGAQEEPKRARVAVRE